MAGAINVVLGGRAGELPPINTNAYYANVDAVMAKYYWGIPRPTSELVRDLGRIGQLLQRGQLPL